MIMKKMKWIKQKMKLNKVKKKEEKEGNVAHHTQTESIDDRFNSPLYDPLKKADSILLKKFIRFGCITWIKSSFARLFMLQSWGPQWDQIDHVPE